MRLHQVLTGASNVFENNVAVAVGTVDGRPFTAYGSGYDVAVLDGDFHRVQVLSESTQDNDCIVRCVTCSDGNGKIAASFGNRIFIYEPDPVSIKSNDTNKRLPYRWVKVHNISTQSEVYTISLDKDGKRLLIGSKQLSIWRCFSSASDDVNHSVWENVWSRRMPTPIRYLDFSPDGHYFASAGMDDRMIKIWFQASKGSSTGISAFGIGQYDDNGFREVRQLFVRNCMRGRGLVSHGKDAGKTSKEQEHEKLMPNEPHHHRRHHEIYNFVYILHPKAVTGFSWRQKSRQMPLTCVLNVLLTSCADNVCRIWAETVKQRPLHSSSSASFHNQTKQLETLNELEVSKDVLPRDSSVSLVDLDAHVDQKINASFHRYHVISMYHFHLASVINPKEDIALLSTIPTGSVFGKSFQLQWLNNKEIQFTTSYELLINDQVSNGKEHSRDDSSLAEEDYTILGGMEFDGEMEANEDTIVEEKDDSTHADEEDADSGFDSKGTQDSRSPTTSSALSFSASVSSLSSAQSEKLSSTEEQAKKKGIPATVSAQINKLLRDWCTTGDTLFCIHPVDGSLLIWLVDYLDDFTSAFYRQPQVSFASRIPAAFTKADASSLNWSGIFYYKNLSRLVSLDYSGLTSGKHQPYSQSSQQQMASDLAITHLSSFLVSAHSDGTLNLWQLTFSDVSSFTGIASVTHLRRNCGPRFATALVVTHPILPLVISTSKNSASGNRDLDGQEKRNASHQCIEECASELMLWRSDLVGPLSQLGGVTETSRISSNDISNFKNVAWFPHLFEHSLISLPGPDGTNALPCTPCACFVTSSDRGLHLHQVVLDAKTLLSALTSRKANETNLSRENLLELIESEQSGSKSTCVMPLCDVADSGGIVDLQFLHVFTVKDGSDQQHEPASTLSQESTSIRDRQKHQSHWGPFYIVAISAAPGVEYEVRAWEVQPISPSTFSPVTPISTDSSSSQFSLSPVLSSRQRHSIATTACIETRQICVQRLPVEVGKQALIFSAASDIPSSSCQNATCPVPFWFSVASSDNHLRFFGLNFGEGHETPRFKELANDYDMNSTNTDNFKVLAVAHAHSYRLAWMSAECKEESSTPRITVTVLESESTGSDSWRVEDTIELPYQLPANVTKNLRYLETLPIGLTWLSLENGAFILSAALGNSIYILYQYRTSKQPLIVSATSSSVSAVKWNLLSTIDLQDKVINTVTWTRDGMLLVGVRNELRVYSQWELMSSSTENLDLGDVQQNDEGERNMLFSGNILYKAANATVVLPQYHPKHLTALMNLGKMRRVRAILCHLVRCVAGRQAADEAAEAGDIIRKRSRTLSRTYSNLSSSPMDAEDYMNAVSSENSPEVDTIPPVPLHALIAADKDESGALQSKEQGASEDEGPEEVETDYSSLFESKPSSVGALHVDSAIGRSKGTGMSKSAVYFGLAQAQLLAKVLTKRQLPGLNSINQLYLLAIADTVASTNMDLESGDSQERGLNFARRETNTDDKLSHWAGGGGYATTGAIGATAGSGGDVVDDCGLKFLLAVRQHTTLLRSLPPGHRASLEDKGLPSAKIAWAFHSDCQEELLAMVPCMLRGEPNWKELKAHGAGWWVKSSDTLRRLVEKLAKAHFQVKQDPLDCAIFYLAMRKKTLLCALFRSLRDSRMSQFFSHDFTEERWRKAALKNAYALLGKQRFEHAAAFFLLGDALWDAVQVCISKLKDVQLALVISRMYEGDIKEGSTFYRILSEFILGDSSIPPQQDPFIRSMTYWLRRDYRKSLDTLLLDPENPVADDTELKYNEMASMGHPDIFNFYMYLRSQPHIRRCHLPLHMSKPTSNSNIVRKIEPGQYGSVERSAADTGVFAPNEREIVYRTAHTHLNSGMPSIALEVLMLLPKAMLPESNEELTTDSETTVSQKAVNLKTEDMIVSGTISDSLNFTDSSQLNGIQKAEEVSSKAEDFDWSKPVSSKAEDFDWSKPVSSKAEDFDWSKPVSSKADDFDWSKPVSSKADDFDWSKPVSSKAEDFDWSKPVSSKADDFDWSKPVSSKAEDFDWSKPVSSKAEDFDWSKPASSKAEDFDWSKPVSSKADDFDSSLRSSSSIDKSSAVNGLLEHNIDSKTTEDESRNSGQLDLASLHLKYITVFKCLIEELRSLPSTCTLDGVKLRPTVAHLLERELEVLHKLCDYAFSESEYQVDDKVLHEAISRRDSDVTQYSDDSLGDLSSERSSLSQKADLLTRKIQWLRRNETILTTLYNCCALQGVGGENLPAICLELLFLLHELEHYRSLAAPLHAFSSGQTVPPLLLATMTTYSLFTNPVTYLSNMTHDILRMLLRLPELPNAQNPVNVASALESLSLSLSSCIFHSLCGGHEDHLLETIRQGEMKIIGKENKEGKLVRQTSRTTLDVPGSQRKDYVTPTSLPSRWPGVQMLSSIIAARNKDGPKSLRILLCQAAVAVYVALLVTSTSQFLPNQLYRLVMNQLSADIWGLVFGGGTKLVLLDEASSMETKSLAGDASLLGKDDGKKRVDTTRMKWNFRLLGMKAKVPTSESSTGKFVQQELFIPPQMTLYDYFLKKPATCSGSFEYNSQDSFDTDEEEYLDDDSDAESDKPIEMADNSHLNQFSYSWKVITLCVLKVVLNGITNFLTAAGLEVSDLPSISPLLYSVIKLILKWQTQVKSTLENSTPPEDFLPINITDYDDGVTRGGPTLQRIKLLMDPNNTPFRSSKKNADPVKRLWHALVHQDSLRETLLQLSFPKDTLSDEALEQESLLNSSKIIYKDPDLAMGFNFNNANRNTIALAGAHEVIELDVAGLTDTEGKGSEELNEKPRRLNSEDDVLNNRMDRTFKVTLKRSLPGVRRMHSHPNLPFYITGGNDGSIRMFEFGHPDQILSYRGSSVRDRVNRIRFNTLGNKFGACDDSGYLSLWTLSNSTNPKPFVEVKAYSRQVYDFAFLGSSSLIATAGYSSDSKTVCMWDTLMPSRRSLVHSFIHSNHASQAVYYIPGQQCLLSGGRRGNIFIFDIRQRKLLHTFQAHDSAIKCFAVDPSEEFFVSGSADGDIKVWGLSVHELYDIYKREHMRGTYLRHGSTGVQQLQILPAMHLMSCGSDGSLKLRQLRTKDTST